MFFTVPVVNVVLLSSGRLDRDRDDAGAFDFATSFAFEALDQSVSFCLSVERGGPVWSSKVSKGS